MHETDASAAARKAAFIAGRSLVGVPVRWWVVQIASPEFGDLAPGEWVDVSESPNRARQFDIARTIEDAAKLTPELSLSVRCIYRTVLQ